MPVSSARVRWSGGYRGALERKIQIMPLRAIPEVEGLDGSLNLEIV